MLAYEINLFNKIYVTDPEVYYFSFPTYATVEENGRATHRPDSKMSFHLWPTSLLMGHDSASPDNTWYENDGICNTVSMTHPYGSPVKIYNNIPYILN